MTSRVTNVAVLGSTGSIGTSTLEVIAASGGRLRAVALAAHSRVEQLAEQAAEFHPRWVVIAEPEAAARHGRFALPPGVQLLTGPEGIAEVVQRPEVDIVVSAIVGSAGLQGTWAALEAGKTVALANKETLVMAGQLVMQLARGGENAECKMQNAEWGQSARRFQSTGETPVPLETRNSKLETSAARPRIIPIDSEPSAIFQALQAGRREELRRIILTASGGPFRRHTPEQLARVTVDEALAHPTWDMGPEITVDSATMMNKALEIIEARWLFDLRPEQIDVVIHPQSIVHSLVEFIDGSVVAQMSPPDMKLPIQYALTYPERRPGIAAKLDFTDGLTLDFEPPDFERFPALALGLEAARAGGTTGAVLNAANEAAVAGFLDGDLSFAEIVPTCRRVLEHHEFDPNPTLEQLIALDRWARQEVSRWVCT